MTVTGASPGRIQGMQTMLVGLLMYTCEAIAVLVGVLALPVVWPIMKLRSSLRAKFR